MFRATTTETSHLGQARHRACCGQLGAHRTTAGRPREPAATELAARAAECSTGVALGARQWAERGGTLAIGQTESRRSGPAPRLDDSKDRFPDSSGRLRPAAESSAASHPVRSRTTRASGRVPSLAEKPSPTAIPVPTRQTVRSGPSTTSLVGMSVRHRTRRSVLGHLLGSARAKALGRAR